MGCKGLHCPGCGDGGSGLALPAIVLAVLVIGSAGAITQVLSDLLEIMIITACGLAGLTVLAVTAVIIYRYRIPESRRYEQRLARTHARGTVPGSQRAAVGLPAPRTARALPPGSGQPEPVQHEPARRVVRTNRLR